MSNTTAGLKSSTPARSTADPTDRSILVDTGLWLFLTAPLSFVLVLAVAMYLSHKSF